MKKVAIVGLGWLGMPLALSLMSRGWQVTGSKTTQDGVEAARMCGIDSYPLRLEPQLVCDAEDLDALMNVDALVITLPSGAGHDAIAMAERWPSAMLFVRCKGGISHHPAESVTADDVALAIEAYFRAVTALDAGK